MKYPNSGLGAFLNISAHASFTSSLTSKLLRWAIRFPMEVPFPGTEAC